MGMLLLASLEVLRYDVLSEAMLSFIKYYPSLYYRIVSNNYYVSDSDL